jgi:trans-2,3-dihydro-3-hydroxyanthranilic acid synthase
MGSVIMPGIPAIEAYRLPEAGELPDNVARWTPDPARSVLLVHDMQRYFLRPFPDSLRRPLLSNVALLLDRARELGVPIGYTAQPGDMSEEQRGLLKHFWGPGMHRSPQDQDVADEVAPGLGDWSLMKWRYSAFFNSGLLDRIRAAGRDQLVLCGVYAHVGVLMTAVESYSNDLETFLVADAVADFTAEYHQAALRYAAERCAVVLTAKEVFR